MKLKKIKKVILIFLVTNFLLIGWVFSYYVFAIDYPTKPIALIVGFPAGGGGDLVARVIAEYFTKKWGQKVIVVNKPGGNLIPAVLEVYSSKPDGYTLLVDMGPCASVQYAVFKELPYKLEDRTFLVNAVLLPQVYLCSVTRPWKTLKEVADFVKRDPGNFRWGAIGVTSNSTFSGAQFLDFIGVDIFKTKKIDQKGGPELLTSIAGGHIDFSNYGLSPSLPLIEAGKIHPLAIVSSPGRLKRLPNIPTVKEEGFPDYIVWIGISGPPGLPKEVIEKWDQGMKEASTDSEFILKNEKMEIIVNYLPPNAYKKMVLEDAKNLKELAIKMGFVTR